MVILSSILAFSSSSWVMVWVFMEINSLCMCVTMVSESKFLKNNFNSSMSYMIVQLTSSIVLLIVLSNMTNFYLSLILGIFCLIIKTGSWPFHLWYAKALSSMEFNSLSMKVLMTWQKFLPFLILQFFYSKTIILLVGGFTMLIPMVKLLPHISLKSVFILSSINNNGWFMISSVISTSIFVMFFLIYSISLIISFSFFKNLKSKFVSAGKQMWASLLVLSNMSGVPPSAMFMIKCVVLSSLLVSLVPKEMLLLMMVMACLFLYNYFWCVMNQIFSANLLMKTQIYKKETFSSMNVYTLVFLCFLSGLLMILG